MAGKPATKSKKKPAKKANGKSNGRKMATVILDVPVEFGGVSIGDQTARLGVRIDRGDLNITAADEIFCGHRLAGRIQLGTNGDSAGQTHLFDVEESLVGTFDVKRIGVNVKSITSGLTLSLADVDIEMLAKFSKGSGRIIVESVNELPDDVADDDDDDPAAGFLPGSLKAEGPWRDVPLDTMLGGALLKCLKKAGLDSMGALSDYTASEKRLTDIDGIGEAAVAKIEAATLEFWKQNPQYSEGK